MFPIRSGKIFPEERKKTFQIIRPDENSCNQAFPELAAIDCKIISSACLIISPEVETPIISVRSYFSSVFRFSFSFKSQICTGRTEIVSTFSFFFLKRKSRHPYLFNFSQVCGQIYTHFRTGLVEEGLCP